MSSLRTALVSSGSNISTTLLKIVITFVVTPIVLRALGRHDYGIWEMVMAVIGYTGLLELGLKPAISRFVARYVGLKDDSALRRLYATALAVFTVIGVVVSIGCAVVALFGTEWLVESGKSPHRYAMFMGVLAIQMIVVFPGHVAESVLEGMQLYSRKNMVTNINSILGAVATVSLIDRFDPLLFLCIANAIGVGTKYIVFFFLVNNASGGGLRIRRTDVCLQTLTELTRFSFKSMVQGIATTVDGYSPPLIVGTVLSPSSVVLYALPAALARQVRTFGWTLTHSFMPLFSELHAKGKAAEARHVFTLASRLFVAVLTPVWIALMLLGPDFIEVWAGRGLGSDSGVVGALVATSVYVSFLNPFASRYLTAVDEHGILAKVGSASAIVSLACAVILVHVWGIEGVALGGLLGAIVSFPIILARTCGAVGITQREYLSAVLFPSVVPAGLAAASIVLYQMAIPTTGYFRIAACAVGAGAVYALAWLIFASTKSESAAVRRLIGKALSLVRFD